MSFIAKLQRAREALEQQQRLSLRALGRELELEDDALEEIVFELVDVQGIARREGSILVWSGSQTAPHPAPAARPTISLATEPRSHGEQPPKPTVSRSASIGAGRPSVRSLCLRGCR